MQKKKLFLLLCVGVLALSVMTGCGKKEAAEESEETKKAETKVEKVEEVKTIGTKTDDAFSVKLENTTGQDITSVSIKSSNDAEYPANMLESSDKFATDEVREVYYTPSEATASTATADGKEITPEYLIQLVLADGSTYELHAFPFGDIEEGKIELEEGVAYVSYTSVSTKETVSTLESEKAVKAQAEAAAAAEAQAQAEAAAAAQAQAEAEAAAAAAQAASETYYEENTYTEPAYTEPVPETNNDACVGDGLTW